MVIDPQQLSCMKAYSNSTGEAVKDCLYEALDMWIRTVAATTMLPVSQIEKPSNLLPFPNVNPEGDIAKWN